MSQTRRGLARLSVENHRGVPVPRTLGFAVLGGAAVSTVVVAVAGEVGALGWGALAALTLIGVAGLLDDLAPSGPRGLRGHLRSASRGRVTTGIVKLVVIAGSSVVVAALDASASTGERLAGAVLLAASANVWNGLDVRPGRALKAFVPIGVVSLAFAPLASAPAVIGVSVVALVALPLDLRERAMLGDAGANVLGFTAGLALLAMLPGGWLVVAATVAVAMNVVAETVSFSRVIAAVPPLRWLDGLGRRP